MKGILNIILVSLNLFFLSRCSSGIPACSNSQINNVGEGNGSCIDKSACAGYVTGTSCETQCADSEYATSITASGKTYFQCSACSKAHVSSSQLLCLDACDSEISQSEKKRCLILSSCKNYVSLDKSSCLDNCPLGQIAQAVGSGDTAYQYCTKKCSGDTPLYQSLNDVESCVKECDTSLIEFTADGTCQNKSACILYLSSDKKKCTTSCENDYLLLTENQTYKVCSATCASQLYSYTQNSVKTCNNKCPSDFIKKESTKTCLANIKDCDLFFYLNTGFCVESCDANLRQFSMQQSGFKICYYCVDFFMPATQTTQAACVKTCPTGYIGSMTDYQCYLLSTASTLGCVSMQLSSDKKTCNTSCSNSDVNIGDYCVAACTTPGCSNCPDDQIFDTSLKIKCIASGKCSNKLSSDGKKCVAKCYHIDEVEVAGSQTCSKCPEDKVYYLTDQGVSDCKYSEELTNEDTSLLLTRALKNSLFLNQAQSEVFSNKLSEKTKKLYQELTSSSNIKNALTIIEEDLKLLQQALPSELKTEIVKVGSSSTIMSFLKEIKYEEQVKTSLNLKSLLEGSSTDLIEFRNKIEFDYHLRVLVTVIVSNPACKTSGCEKYPIIQAQILEAVVSGRMLNLARTFTVDLTVTEASSKYVCLNYNLETSEVVGTYTVPVASNNGLTMTCEVNGATQIFLDSSCVYLDKSKCANPSAPTPDGGNSGISTGAVIGIVIGAVVGAIIGSVGGYFLYKKFAKTRAINYEVKYPESIPTSEV